MSKKKISVLFAASEAEPFAKVGGLADVAGSLPRALKSLSNYSRTIDIRLCLPYYPRIKVNFADLPLVAKYPIENNEGRLTADVYHYKNENLAVYFIDGSPIRLDPDIYNLNTALVGDKFVFFNRAIAALLKNGLFTPDILHLNDWHTALVPYILRNESSPISDIPSLITLHNLPFMGDGIQESLTKFQIKSSSDNNLPEWALHLPLPMGLTAVDHIVPVSPTYAREIIHTEAGCGLNQFFNFRKKSITGILNGLDTDFWNPLTDTFISSNFSLETHCRRSINKQQIVSEFNFEDPKSPILAIISRMDQQKGIDIAIDSLREITNKPWNLIVLGSGNPELENYSKELMQEYPMRVRVVNTYNAELSHRLYAGADMLLMPSRYEPCGLSQLIAMRYGCIPIATDVGGLHDTIIDIRKTAQGTGFLCSHSNGLDFSETILDALDLYSDQSNWSNLVRNAMEQDFSWKKSAHAYLNIYTQLLNKGKHANN